MKKSKTKYLLAIIFVVLSNIASAQLDTRQLLIQNIYEECTLNFPDKFVLCKYETKVDLEEKFNAAEIYLTVQLSRMIRGDSSTYYEKKKQELINIEKKEPLNKIDSLVWNNKKEKSFLLLSVLRPWDSDSLFTKLLHSYFHITPVTFVDNAKFESFFYYQLWLNDLLDNRFREETNDYARNKAVLHYNKAISLCTQQFLDIDNETKLLYQLEECIKKSTKDNLIDKEFKNVMSYLYVLRASKGTKIHSKNRNDSLFQFLESVYLKAWELTPEHYMSNKNFGLLYYNEAASIMESISENDPMEEITAFQKRAMILLERAIPYMEKVEQLSLEKIKLINNLKKE